MKRIAATAILALAALAGCAGADRPPLADTWGLSVRHAIEAQKLDPGPKNDAPVTGLDGVFAKNAYDGYRKSAEVDPQTGKAKEPLKDSILVVKEARQ